jgi:hypothetical protein
MTIIEEATMKSIQGIYKKLPDLNSVTLRDLFAMCVMTGTLRSASYTDEEIKNKVERSYRIADIMIKVRSQK